MVVRDEITPKTVSITMPRRAGGSGGHVYIAWWCAAELERTQHRQGQLQLTGSPALRGFETAAVRANRQA